MQPRPSRSPANLGQAVREMIRSPVRTIAPPWSWKAAVFSAILRALAFFALNLRAGSREATKAMIVEAVFVLFTAGLIGAVSQHLRNAEPLWMTALLVWAGLPGLMLLAQLGVHHLASTPYQSGALFTSFCLSSVASSFTWYAMRHGAMLGGVDETPILEDVKALPGLLLDFFLTIPRFMHEVLHAND